ncbi:uncharacterized protein LOC121694866 [Alosa sapidissima]|uniref:uncharacterized protein LOC121694866 n=1 Tax=Alosa sapidissima TaxID=34773 RepID=UPI001C0994D6|nr:uncharacterized protein LOC121694866 [Alosa sapidissima]
MAHEDGVESGQVESADSPWEMSTPSEYLYQCYVVRSRHDGSRHRSRQDDRSRGDAPSPPARPRQDDRSHGDAPRPRQDDRSRGDAPSPPARPRQDDRSHGDAPRPRQDDRSRGDAPSPPARPCQDDRSHGDAPRPRQDDRSRGDAPSPRSRHDRLRHDAVTESGRWAFPLPWDVFQKRVLSLLVDVRNRLKETQPASSAVHMEKIDTMEDFELQEQRLSDAQTFDTLVLQISRIGGRNTKDCAHKVLDRLFTNSLMAKFNLKGKGKKEKRPLEGTKVYRAIQEGLMKFDPTATEENIKANVSEHLKHAPQRRGGGGFTSPDKPAPSLHARRRP